MNNDIEISIKIKRKDGEKHQYVVEETSDSRLLLLDPFVGCLWPSEFYDKLDMTDMEFKASGTYYINPCKDTGMAIFIPSETYSNN